MKEIGNKITQLRCQEHAENTLEFLCIEKVCRHVRRMMCVSCIRDNNLDGIVRISQTFQQLSSQYDKYNNDLKQCKSKIWQYFRSKKAQLIEQIQQLETQVAAFIDSNFGQKSLTQCQEYIAKKEVDANNIQDFAKQLSEIIMPSNIGEFEFCVQQQNINSSQDKFFQYNEKAMKVLSCQIQSIFDKVNQYNNQSEIDLNIQPINIVEQQNNNLQIINLDGICLWLTFNHDKTQIAATVQNNIRIFNLSAGGQWIQDEQILTGHKDIIRKIHYNHNSTQIASCGKDNVVLTWIKDQNGKWVVQNKLSQHTDEVHSVQYNHDSTMLASGSFDKSILIYKQMQGNWHFKQKLTDNEVTDLCFNYNSKLLASGSANNSIVLWNYTYAGLWQIQQILTGHTKPVIRVAFNSNSTLMVSGGYDNQIRIWSISQNIWQCQQQLTGHNKFVRSVYFNSQSNMLVSCDDDKSIKLWRKNQRDIWECTETIIKHKEPVYCAIINNDSSMILSGSIDKTILIHRK